VHFDHGRDLIGHHRHRPDGEVRKRREQPGEDGEPLAEPDVAGRSGELDACIRRVQPLIRRQVVTVVRGDHRGGEVSGRRHRASSTARA
jgi:hypothetical protein